MPQGTDGESSGTASDRPYPEVKDLEIPEDIVQKWQQLLDITAEIFEVPAGLIMRIDPPYIEVFEASGNPENPYEIGGTEDMLGLYCEEVVLSQEPLHVPDAQQSDRWRDNMDVEEFGLVSYLGYPIEWPGGAVFGTICVLDDEEREFEGIYRDLLQQFKRMVEVDLEMIVRQQELEAKNDRLQEFATIVSHDLRNPLNVAEGQLELAQQEYTNEHLRAVERAHERIHVLIDDLLTLARNTDRPTELASIELGAFAESSWQNVDVGDATLHVDVEQTVRADASRLGQVFENLYRNAIEHGGADVHVWVGPLEDGFYVEDDGPGIDVADRERVFESGYTNSRTGSGYGLAIVADIVAIHGWDVEIVESAAGGARFEFRGVE
ncbi:GAF domain-containing sensor histidine kinase [Halorubrum salinum]|uniref:GAF domain-containing sensor histidine kinase n=1 Tax=Halorubrum salinum TaxID=767517 RepID=UPI0021128F0C|nr:GAF domain-containing sensor histidine kinase [Halorubrum salinum]